MSATALLESRPGAPPVAGSWPEETRHLVRLAGPVAISQVGQLTMGLVDTWMVGGISTAALGAVSLGDSLFFTFAVVALGTVQAVEPQVSQAHGAGDPGRARAAWEAGRRLALWLALPLLLLALLAPALLALAGLGPEVERLSGLYLQARAPGILFGLLFAADRAFLHGLGHTRPAMLAMLLANLVNAALDWALIYGRLGVPPLGVAGAGWATTGCMVLNWFVVRGFARRLAPPAAAAPGRGAGLIRRTLRLGIPLGLGHGTEVGAFAVATLFMGWLGTVPLAAHQVAIKMASTSFMLALAVGTATAIRVGHAIGARRPHDAARAGRVGLALGFLVMGTSGLLYVLFGREIVASFTDDAAVIELGAALMVVAAAFQLSDGSQAILAGALRGAGDTAWPFWANLVAYYLVALPLAWALVFRGGEGPVAVWWALALGLTGAALIMGVRFSRVVHRAVPLS